MREIGEIAKDCLRIGAAFILHRHFGNGPGGVSCHHCFEKINDAGAIRNAKHGQDIATRNLSIAKCDGLVQERKTVTHRAFRCARNEP